MVPRQVSKHRTVSLFQGVYYTSFVVQCDLLGGGDQRVLVH